jgi:phosphoglycolate phosphatase
MTVLYQGSLRTCLLRWLPAARAEAFFTEHSELMAGSVRQLRTFAGIGSALASLPIGGMSIVTSAYGTAVREILSLDPTFDQSVVHSIIGRETRATKTVKISTLLRELELDAADAVYVGDLESDILYCREVPIDIIAAGYGYHPSAYLARFNPTYLVQSIEELADLLEALLPAREARHASATLH